MKRFSLLLIIVLGLVLGTKANHITGGEIFYRLTAQSGNDYTYAVTLKLYRDHFSTGAQLDANAPIAIFDRLTGAVVWSNTVPKTFTEFLDLLSPEHCINN